MSLTETGEEQERPFLSKRSLWVALIVAAALIGASYLPLPDTATVLRVLAGLTVACGLALARASDTR
jgi:hypothetical protein